MRALSVSFIALCVVSAAPPVFAQSDASIDGRYGAYVLMCEARYREKGTAEDIEFWTSTASALTESERRLGQGALGTVTKTIAQIDDRIIVQRCDEFRTISEDPDGYVVDDSPELAAAQERVQDLVQIMLAELIKAGFKSDYLNNMMINGADVANRTDDELERANWLEIYFQSTIQALQVQTKALSAAGLSNAEWGPECAALMSTKHAKAGAALIETNAFDAAIEDAQKAVLYDRLEIVLLKAKARSLANKSAVEISIQAITTPSDLASCEASGTSMTQIYVDGPAKRGTAQALAEITARAE